MPFRLRPYHDYVYAFILGLISALFLVLIEITMGFGSLGSSMYVMTLVFVPLLAMSGIGLSKILFYRVHPMWQFSKFFLIGVTNTVINFGVLDFLVHISGITSGLAVSMFGAVAFTAALINSYIWNSHWSFHNQSPRTVHEFVRFFLIAFIGVFFNISIIYIIVNFIPTLDGLSPKTWVNIANAVASLSVMFWSFFAYKFLVFAKQVQVHKL